MSDRFQELRKLAPILNKLRPDPNARVSYELMSGALIWSDELPDPSERDQLEINANCLRGVFRYRTTLMLGKPEEKFRVSWEQLQILCPQWPGFLPERRQPDPDRIKLYEESSVKLIAAWEALDARYEAQKAEKSKTPSAVV